MRLPRALIGFGQVRHARHRPRVHAFAYPSYFLMLPLRSLRTKADPNLARNRFAPLSFHDADHGDGQGDCLQWMDQLLKQHGIDDADGEMWLHTFPRVLGYTFKPVSFWYCHRRDGSLRAVVAEVNNTFGERHCYLLDKPAYGVPQTADKVFHVSPFCPVQGQYRFVFMRTGNDAGARTVVRIDYHDEAGQTALIQTSVSGQLSPLTRASSRRAFWEYPAMTFGVMARIHWHALQLWIKRAPFFRQPAAPADLVTRAHSVPRPTSAARPASPSSPVSVQSPS